MKSVILAVAAALALCSCASAFPPTIYDKAGASQSDFDRDISYCKYDVTKNTQTTDTSYTTIFGQELDRSMRQRNLMVMCMQSRGYTPRK